MEILEPGFSGRLATVSRDGYPYCIPLLYVWMDGEVYVHTTSARGHFRGNIDSEPRVCFAIDEPEQVFDYGRFECNSGLAYRSVILFGRIRIAREQAEKQRFCEALMTKYGKPGYHKAQRLLSAPRHHHGLRHFRRANDRKATGIAPALQAVAGEGHDEDAERAALRGGSGFVLAITRRRRDRAA